MKKIIPIALCIAFAAACFTGCVVMNISDSSTVTGRGNPEKYEFQVGQYNGIKVDGFYNIHYHAAPSDIVTLEIQPNLLEYFVVEVRDGDLVVRSTRRINFGSRRGPVLTVSTPVLNRLTIDGASTFTAHDKITSDSLTLVLRGAGSGTAELDVENLSANISGAGKIELSGRAATADLNLAGAGDLNALSLQTQDATINLSGAGSIRVNSSDSLSINANGAGSVLYRGSPRISQNTSGVVSIRQVN